MNSSSRVAAEYELGRRHPERSHAAQASIDKYSPELPPKNDSPDALHADHVYPLTGDLLRKIDSVE